LDRNKLLRELGDMGWKVLDFDFVPFIFVHNSVKFHYENWMRPVVKGGETFLPLCILVR